MIIAHFLYNATNYLRLINLLTVYPPAANGASLIYNQPGGPPTVVYFRAHCFSCRLFMTADPTLDPAPGPRRKVWRAALFVIGSAAFSGVALVLWNRRELTRIRQTNPPPVTNPPDEEII
jgi:hypothetical protein